MLERSRRTLMAALLVAILGQTGWRLRRRQRQFGRDPHNLATGDGDRACLHHPDDRAGPSPLAAGASRSTGPVV
jgi:hypothetical protein